MNKLLAFLIFFAVTAWTATSCSAPASGDATEQAEQTEASSEGDAAQEHADGHDHGHDHDHSGGASHDGPEYTSAYICPMHCPGSGSDQPGKCPACGMDYVANPDAADQESAPAEEATETQDNG
jgi:ABC-type nickel/cobalt efflux system permease component RcnA